MAPNQPLWPREWLMTDERMGERLWEAIGRVPAGGGVVFRHYALAPAERIKIGERVASAANARGLLLSVGRDLGMAKALGAAMVHGPAEPTCWPFSLAVHDGQEAEAARLAGAALAFVSPVFRTSSHPGASALGPIEAARLAEIATCPAIALGGMDEARFRELEKDYPRVFHGYAGIDCWLKPGPSRE